MFTSIELKSQIFLCSYVSKGNFYKFSGVKTFVVNFIRFLLLVNFVGLKNLCCKFSWCKEPVLQKFSLFFLFNSTNFWKEIKSKMFCTIYFFFILSVLLSMYDLNIFIFMFLHHMYFYFTQFCNPKVA